MTTDDLGIRSNGVYLEDDKGPITNFDITPVQVFKTCEGELVMLRAEIRVAGAGWRTELDLVLTLPPIVQQIMHRIPLAHITRQRDAGRIDIYIHLLAAQMDQEEAGLYLQQHGISRLKNGRYIFVAGDMIIGALDGYEYAIASSVAQYHLARDLTLDTRRTVQELCSVLDSNGGVLYPIYGFCLLAAIRSTLNGIGVTTFPSLAIIGPQGFGKTTVCENFLLLYDEAGKPGNRCGEYDAVSTPGAVRNILNICPNQVVVIDDLARSSSKAQEAKRKELVAESLRFASNGSGRSSLNPDGSIENQICAAGMAFTGELHLTSPSDISRTITVELTQPMKNGDPRHRTLAATAFAETIRYLLPKLDTEIGRLKSALAEVVEGDNQRLRKNRILLLWVLRIFCSFARDCGVTNDKEANKMYKRVEQVVDAAIERQMQWCEQSSTLAEYILQGVRNGSMVEVSKKELKRSELPRYPYCKKEKRIYIKPEVLYTYLASETPILFSSEKTMGKELRREGLIRVNGEHRSAESRINGERYLCLRLSDLKKDSRQ